MATTLLANFFSKSATSLMKRLGAILIASIVIMLVFLEIKLNLDATYNKAKFEQFYREQNVDENSNNSTKQNVYVGLTGISIKTEKEHYIDECSKLYGIFNTKAYTTMRTSPFV